MKYLSIDDCASDNGEGWRTVIWFSGCSHGCDGCFNPESWNPNKGLDFTSEIEAVLFQYVARPFIDGITLSGGDPLHKRNYKEVISLCKRFKERFPNKTIWLYTGYTKEVLACDTERVEILSLVDVLVDGPYKKELPSAPFVGSNNQRVIYLK